MKSSNDKKKGGKFFKEKKRFSGLKLERKREGLVLVGGKTQS